MQLREIFSVINKFAPVSISDELVSLDNSYDNSGIIAETKREVNTILFALDLTKECVRKANEIGAQLIITHHPAIFYPIKTVNGALLDAINSGIGVISMHLNFDCCENGIDYNFAKGLGAKSQSIIDKLKIGGYGRVFEVNDSLKNIFENAKKEFLTDKMVCYGNENAIIKKVASFCGAGLEEKYLSNECDLFVSCDVKHHIILQALEMNKCIINMSHYACENYGFKRVFEQLKLNSRFANLKINFFTDNRLL